MSLSKSKCWYSYECLHFLKHAVPLNERSSNNQIKFITERTHGTCHLNIQKVRAGSAISNGREPKSC